MTKNSADKEWEKFVHLYFPNLDFIEISTPSRVLMYHISKILKNGFTDDDECYQIDHQSEELCYDNVNDSSSSFSCYLSVRTTKCQRFGGGGGGGASNNSDLPELDWSSSQGAKKQTRFL